MRPGTPELDAVARAEPAVPFVGNNCAEFSSAQFVKRLLLGTLLLNLIVAALAALALYHSYGQYEERAVVTTQNLARALAQDLSASFDKVDLAVLSVKDEVERDFASGGIDGRTLNAHIALQLTRQPDLDSVRVTNAQGDVIYGTGVASKGRVSAANRDFFIRLRGDPNAALVISKPIVGQISSKWSIALARRINHPNGTFAGVAYAVILLEHFQKNFAALDLGPHGAVSLRDLDLGTVVRQPEPQAVGTAVGNRTFSKEWPEKLKINPVAGTYFAVGLDDRNRALAYRRISEYPFYIIVGLFPGDYLAQWQQEALRTTTLVAVFLVVTLLFSWLIRSAWKRRQADSHQLLELSRLALQQSETQLQLALDGAEMGIWAATPATGEFTATAQAKLLHGLPSDALLNPQAVLASVHVQDRDKVAALFQRTIDREEPLDIELRVMHPDGEFRWVCWRGRWLPAVAGKPGRIIGVVQDVTERKRAEQRKDEFLATLAHELRNPLAPIRNALEVMRLSSEPRVLEKVRSMFERQVANLSRLVDDLFDVSRISQGKLQLQTQQVDLASVIQDAAETSAPLIHAARHRFTMTLPSHPLVVDVDPSRLAQVFSNLLNNAARYTPEAGQIELFAEQQGKYVVVTVADNGIGIPRDMLPRVFNMFTQVDRARERSQGGLGIGLTLVKRLVELHSGSVQVFSEGEGQGCRFVIRLPIVDA